MSRVNSVSSPRRILLFLAISLGVAAAPVPFWGELKVFGTEFYVGVKTEVRESLHFVLFSPRESAVESCSDVRRGGCLVARNLVLSTVSHRLRAWGVATTSLGG